MANIKSAKKRMKKSAKQREINAQKKTKLRTYVKRVRKLVVEKKIEEAEKVLIPAFSVIDKTAKMNLIHKNKANRLKSRLTKMVKSKKVSE